MISRAAGCRPYMSRSGEAVRTLAAAGSSPALLSTALSNSAPHFSFLSAASPLSSGPGPPQGGSGVQGELRIDN